MIAEGVLENWHLVPYSVNMFRRLLKAGKLEFAAGKFMAIHGRWSPFVVGMTWQPHQNVDPVIISAHILIVPYNRL